MICRHKSTFFDILNFFMKSCNIYNPFCMVLAHETWHNTNSPLGILVEFCKTLMKNEKLNSHHTF